MFLAYRDNLCQHCFQQLGQCRLLFKITVISVIMWIEGHLSIKSTIFDNWWFQTLCCFKLFCPTRNMITRVKMLISSSRDFFFQMVEQNFSLKLFTLLESSTENQVKKLFCGTKSACWLLKLVSDVKTWTSKILSLEYLLAYFWYNACYRFRLCY